MTRTDRADEAGFTLLEMLVALSILSLAALALVRLDAFTVRSTGDLAASNAARIVAANAAVDVLTDPAPPAIGAASEAVTNAGLAWTVTRTTAATADPSLLRIDIAVTGAGGGRAALTIVRPAA